MISLMSSGRGLAIVLVATLAAAACDEARGGLGQKCESEQFLGAGTCNPGLACNDAAGYVCERVMSQPAGGACSSDDLCATGLWCQPPAEKCVPFLKEGDSCSDPFSCGPTLVCGKRTIGTGACEPPSDAGAPPTRATVMGTLTLPAASFATKGMVSIYATLPPAGQPVASGAVAAGPGTTVDYAIVDVPAETYFILGFFDVDRSGGTLTPGDFIGWYDHDASGNPPATATAVVPATGTVRFDFSLVVR